MKETIYQMIEKVKKIELIDGESLERFQISLSQLLQKLNVDINADYVNSLLEILTEYNKLPRKPGNADVLKGFLQENSVVKRMEHILGKLGVRI